MIYPTIIMDDFFTEPEKIKNFSSKLKYFKDKDGKWPGKRSVPVHEIDYNFFNYFHLKILSILYPNDYRKISYTANACFQKISGNRHQNPGWVHEDIGSEITAIVYLSHHKNCGTSLWKKKNFFDSDSTAFEKHNFNKVLSKAIEFYEDCIYLFVYEIRFYYYLHNSNFQKILNVDSIYNRIVLFDSNQHHSAENFLDQDIKEDRLTLITFINKVVLNNETMHYPITECRRMDK